MSSGTNVCVTCNSAAAELKCAVESFGESWAGVAKLG